MWVAMIGAAYTTGQHRHLAIDLLVMKLSGARKQFVSLFIQIAIIAFAGIVLVYGGSTLVSSTLESGQITPHWAGRWVTSISVYQSAAY